MRLSIVNDGSTPLTARTVRLRGAVMGLTLFAYDTSVAIDVAPHATEERRFELDLSDLKGQATGLIPTSVEVLGPNRHKLASVSTVGDVRGSLLSVYGWFGIALAVITTVLILEAAWAMAHHSLAPNRFWRGVRFLWPGVGVGLVMIFTLSAARIVVPWASRWAPLLLIASAASFLVGYFTPTPVDDDIDASSGEATEFVIRPVREGSVASVSTVESQRVR